MIVFICSIWKSCWRRMGMRWRYLPWIIRRIWIRLGRNTFQRIWANWWLLPVRLVMGKWKASSRNCWMTSSLMWCIWTISIRSFLRWLLSWRMNTGQRWFGHCMIPNSFVLAIPAWEMASGARSALRINWQWWSTAVCREVSLELSWVIWKLRNGTRRCCRSMWTGSFLHRNLWWIPAWRVVILHRSSECSATSSMWLNFRRFLQRLRLRKTTMSIWVEWMRWRV